MRHGLYANDRVLLHAQGSSLVGGSSGINPEIGGIPTPLSPFYAVNVTERTFGLSLTSGGAPVNFSNNGTNPFFIERVDGVSCGDGRMYIREDSPFSGATLRITGQAVEGSSTGSPAGAGTWTAEVDVCISGRIVPT
jgi:hypothetical protein